MKAILIILAVFCIANADAQGMADPSKWSFKVSIGENDGKPHLHGEKPYQLTFLVTLKPGWHIYALDPGGDGTLIPPSFKLTDSARFQPDAFVEGSHPQETTMEGIDGKVRFFDGKATFYTTVFAKKGQAIKGTYTYQLCNDKMCLPPKTAPFVFKIP